MIGLVVLAAILAPLLPLTMISQAEVVKVRDWWLLGILATGSLWLIGHGDVWLGLIGLWFLWHWRSPALVPSLVSWTGVGATWFLFQTIPRELAGWLPVGWALIAYGQVGVMLWTLRRYGWHRPKGTFGSPAATALFFAMLAPVCPWWGYPALAVGLGLTCSILAFLAVGASLVWLEPRSLILVAPGALLGGILLRWMPAHWPKMLLAWTPRTGTLKPIKGRWMVWKILPGQVTWGGHGPGSMPVALKEWKSRTRVSWMVDADAHMEFFHLVYEYGVVGGLAALAFVVQVLSAGSVGDRWTAAFIAGCVLSMGHWPLRLTPTGLMFLAIAACVR